MKAHKEELQSALEEFLENEHWRKVYINAPAGAKKYLEINFFASLDTDETGAVEEKWEAYWDKECEPLMTVADYRYLADTATDPREKNHLLDKVNALLTD